MMYIRFSLDRRLGDQPRMFYFFLNIVFIINNFGRLNLKLFSKKTYNFPKTINKLLV